MPKHPIEKEYPLALEDVEGAKKHYLYWFEKHEDLPASKASRLLERLMDQAQLVIVGTYEDACAREQHQRWVEFIQNIPYFSWRWKESAMGKLKEDIK